MKPEKKDCACPFCQQDISFNDAGVFRCNRMPVRFFQPVRFFGLNKFARRTLEIIHVIFIQDYPAEDFRRGPAANLAIQ